MIFTLQFLLDKTRTLSLLLIICGLLAYIVDYRTTKGEPQYKRETAFSKTVSYVYIIGAILAYIVVQVVTWFL